MELKGERPLRLGGAAILNFTPQLRFRKLSITWANLLVLTHLKKRVQIIRKYSMRFAKNYTIIPKVWDSRVRDNIG